MRIARQRWVKLTPSTKNHRGTAQMLLSGSDPHAQTARLLPRHGSWLLLVLLALALAGCENASTAFMVENRNHALVWVREQRWPWADVEQFVLVSRLPVCQRRWRIQPDASDMTPAKVYEAGELLWAIEQKNRWYLATTEDCKVQVWPNPNPIPPGPLVGEFRHRDGKLVFVPASK